MSVATPAAGDPAAFFYRPYHYDHNFLRSYAGNASFDAALLLGRHLAPHPAGSVAERRGDTGRELPDAVVEAGGGFVVDPDTAILSMAPADRLPNRRIPLMAAAQVVAQLPLSPMSLAGPADRQAFVQATIGAQAGAFAVTAPYFQFEQRGDAWHHLNIGMAAETATLDPSRRLMVFVQAPIASLVAGHVAAVATDYASTGAGYAMLRMAGFDPQQADATTTNAYRQAIDAFNAAGVTPIADSVGRFGLVCVAAGAGGFSSGARFYQTVPENPIYDSDEMTSTPELYEVPERWFAINPSVLRAHPGAYPTCPVGGCVAEPLKEHLIHYFTHRARQFRSGGVAAARTSLAAHPTGNYTAVWLAAL